jgi:putative polyhydroxyalkanoate system protein
MPTISIRRPHALAQQQARAAAETIARQLSERFDLAHQWQRDVLTFRRAGVSGDLHVTATHIELTVRLGLLLAPLAPTIEREIRRKLDAALSAANRV